MAFDPKKIKMGDEFQIVDMNLTIDYVDSPGKPVFNAIYDLYKKIFTLPEEQESQENLERNMGRKDDPAVQKAAGPCKEMWIYLRDKNNKVIAATNFAVSAGSYGEYTNEDGTKETLDGTVHSIYSFVDPVHRKKGLYKILAEAVMNVSKDFVKGVTKSEDPNIFTILEQNSPLLMTPSQYLSDIKDSGMDPCVRRPLFEKLGFRQLNMRYIQPTVEKGGATCKYLDLLVQASRGKKLPKEIPASFVESHLARLCTLSFPAGTTLAAKNLQAMMNSIRGMLGGIKLLSAGRFDDFIGRLTGIVKAFPVIRSNQAIGDILPHEAERFYGKEGLKKHSDVLTRQRRGQRRYHASLKEEMADAAQQAKPSYEYSKKSLKSWAHRNGPG